MNTGQMQPCPICGSMIRSRHVCFTCIHIEQQRREKAEREAREQQEQEEE